MHLTAFLTTSRRLYAVADFLLLMFTNIPKSGKKKLLFKEEMQVLTNPKNPKPRHSIKPLLWAVLYIRLIYL
ncbi:hypothetical protein Q767_13315 [Flavobacterium enshiense DK69]|uniref:Uncharacterized protein n=1 Tax=Flavobacterium enshiense DK69 TaxID=1107311 RepID=A0A0A2MPD7_9FLAO|nr:hypothetical protein Q767_13315 [Flavobacterium enshiense DK69]